MMSNEFRKKPVVIKARQLLPENHQDVAIWIAGSGYEVRHATKPPMRAVTGLVIKTLEGDMAADYGDWIICGVAGEFYPCKPDIFATTYDPVVYSGDTDPAAAGPAEHSWFSKAALDVTAERRRQIEAEGWEPQHDDIVNKHGELAWAAACYAVAGGAENPAACVIGMKNIPHALWPWALHGFNPKDRRADLVRAAALLIAEIERLDRAEAKS